MRASWDPVIHQYNDGSQIRKFPSKVQTLARRHRKPNPSLILRDPYERPSLSSLFVRHLPINHTLLSSPLLTSRSVSHLSFILIPIREMAMQIEGSSHAPSAQIVGNLFVERYYLVLHTSPDQVHKFYQDSSVISRPDLDGVMTSATTTQGINNKIRSFDLKDYKTEILTADAQESCNKGVVVLVTGCLTGKDNTSQWEFLKMLLLLLGPQIQSLIMSLIMPYKVTHLLLLRRLAIMTGKFCDPSDTKLSVVEVVVASSSRNDVSCPAESASTVQEDAQKISYASILARESTVTSPVHVATSSTVWAPPSSTEQLSHAPAARKTIAPQSNGSQSSNGHAEAKGIYIGNLPTDVTVQQLETAFKIFGPIKHDSIQIRQFKEDGFCYGFVDFESSNSAISALQAHKITIGNKEAYIEEKRTFTRAENGRRFPSGRGGFRNDNYRGRDNYGGIREYRKYDNDRGEFSGQSWGPTGRNGEAYRRGFQNGGSRGARRGGMK
ncbi:hypothetical protein F0562_033874 [Nyssa sinensis]|uniref:RRM domain-containing protein n=1 Tax=Nyssa sinensis TaxID=561372 RepID=A0A5J5AIQ4_9ASTE|nr:hypothetical protein F0562_033874 [Nyssa sinensis]